MKCAATLSILIALSAASPVARPFWDELEDTVGDVIEDANEFFQDVPAEVGETVDDIGSFLDQLDNSVADIIPDSCDIVNCVAALGPSVATCGAAAASVTTLILAAGCFASAADTVLNIPEECSTCWPSG